MDLVSLIRLGLAVFFAVIIVVVFYTTWPKTYAARNRYEDVYVTKHPAWERLGAGFKLNEWHPHHERATIELRGFTEYGEFFEIEIDELDKAPMKRWLKARRLLEVHHLNHLLSLNSQLGWRTPVS